MAFAAFAFAWGSSASALPPLDPMRLKYCLTDPSTEPTIYYLAANKQTEAFQRKRCAQSDFGADGIVPEKPETTLEASASASLALLPTDQHGFRPASPR
jgi:hypothetical protein